MPRDLILYLEEILESLTKVKNYTRGITFDHFEHDEFLQDAVIRNLEIIGEAIKQIPNDIKNKYNYPWKDVAGLRDILIHQYFSISIEIIWDIIETELNPLIEIIKLLIKDELGA